MTLGGLKGAQNLALTNEASQAVALSLGGNNQSTSYSGILSGAGSLTKTGVGTFTLSGVNTFSGGLAVADGVLSIGTINNAGANGTLGSGLSAVILGSSGKRGTLSYTGASTSSSRAFSADASGTAAFEVTNSASTLTLSGLINGDGQKRFGGAGNFVLNGGLSGAGHVIKTGAGSLTLGASGTFSHTGTTTVEAGTLVVNGSLGTGDLTVLSGATLKGAGTINGFTTVEGIHSPGNSPGLETFTDGLSYGSSSLLVWELSADTALSSDRGILYDGIDLTGGSLSIVPGASINLVFNAALAGGGSSTVDWDDTFWASSQSWKVIDVQSGLWSPGVFTLGSIGVDASGQSLTSSIRSGATFSVVQRDGGDIYVEYVIVPEPATIVVGGIGIALAGWSLRKRRRIA
jgi:autotransporter-associated beta strand protein